MVREKRAADPRPRLSRSRHLESMMSQSLGSRMSMTREEAAAVAAAAFGKRPDLPPGEEYVRRLRPIWRGLLKKQHG